MGIGTPTQGWLPRGWCSSGVRYVCPGIIAVVQATHDAKSKHGSETYRPGRRGTTAVESCRYVDSYL